MLINEILYNFFLRLGEYIPNFLGGLLILAIGIVLSSIFRRLLLSLFSFFRLASLLERTNLMKKSEVKVWQEVLAEIGRWTIIILFLIPTLEVWGLSQATTVLNQFLLYIPNVIVAVIIGFIGIIVSNMAAEVVSHSFVKVEPASAASFGLVTKVIIIFFTMLAVLNQLGVAQDLIRILFTAIVAMIALAGGLAFGLGGKDVARDLLQELVKKLRKK